MQILQRFFKEAHKQDATSLIEKLKKNKMELQDSLHESLKAIILSTNENNFELFCKSKTFLDICTKLYKEYFNKNIEKLELNNIKELQGQLLQISDKTQLKNINNFILKLNASELIANESTRKLTQLLSELSFNANRDSKATNQKLDLKSLKQELESILKKLYDLELSDSIYKSFQKLYDNAKQEKFSIGITGVLSAGKSTFLNALLGREILGSSTIPETANLTVLKYEKNEYAKVYFWNTKEWEELIEAGNNDESLSEFVKECNNIFGDKLSNYIQDSTQSIDISLGELSNFTSANHESKMCNLVKEVVLFTNLEFLQNGVEIVDTPGLDDPIVKREEITKGYISNCDLLIHVMNASCVATQIDIDFILESLIEQNISRLLIVLTRIDLISQRELEQSLEYTKSSLTFQLKKSEYKGDIEALIDRIDFIPVASFLALLHKTNKAQEAIDKGYDYEKTGIKAVENYLNNMLLGENSIKQKDILYLAYKGFSKVIARAKNELIIESKLLNASDEELDKTIEDLKNENKQLLELLDKKRIAMDSKLEELNKFLETIQNETNKHLKMEQDKLKDRIYADAIYGYETNQPLAPERINEIISGGLNDCFSDTIRDYKYKISKKITQLLSNEASFEQIKQPQINFNINKDQLNTSLVILQEVPKLISSHSKRNKDELSTKLDSVFSKSFDAFSDTIKSKGKDIEEKFLTYFNELAFAQKSEIEEKIAKQQETMESALQKRNRNDIKELIDSVSNKQKLLYNIGNEVDYIAHALR